MASDSWLVLGCGVGLRSQHYPVITETWPRMDWFEAISENYMDSGGRPLQILEQVRHHYPIALHGTALSIGSIDPLNQDYLDHLRKLVDRIDPFIVSDHLCWSGVEGEVLHDLLPLPFTEEAIEHTVKRVDHVQEFLGRRILLENVSTYVTYKHSVMPEWEFLTEVANRSGCGILLDINNIYVNATNHQFDPHEYLKSIPAKFVGQIHLAGHTDMGSFLFDTHSAPVIHSVWELYREALSLLGPVSTLIEWDENIPPFERLTQEVDKAKLIYKEFVGRDHVIASAAKQSKSFEIASATPETLLRSDGASVKTSLLEAQEWMRSRIQFGEESSETSALTSRGKELLNPQGGVPGEERASVYANGYPARIHESLKEVYEAVHHVLGDDTFLEASFAYAHQHPSHDYNLNFVGRHLPEFLQASHFSKTFPFIADLAKLEWLIWKAFHAFDQVTFHPEQLTEVPVENWEQARLVFQPSVSLIASSWPILDIWRTRREDSEEIKTDLTNRPQQILIGRNGDQVRCELLDPNQYQLIKGLLSGETLGAVCERLAGTSSGEELQVAAWFSNWVKEGLIVRCEFLEKAIIQPSS